MGPRGPGEVGVRAIGRPFSFPGIGCWRRPVDAVEAADFLDAGGLGNVGEIT